MAKWRCIRSAEQGGGWTTVESDTDPTVPGVLWSCSRQDPLIEVLQRPASDRVRNLINRGIDPDPVLDPEIVPDGQDPDPNPAADELTDGPCCFACWAKEHRGWLILLALAVLAWLVKRRAL